MASTGKKVGKLALSIALIASVAIVLSVPIDIIPPLGGLIDPFRGIWTIYQTAEHPPYQTVIAPGQLSAPVTVIRDSWGVPHIFAKTDQDLYFAVGYVQAQDRLWQMDMWRRQGRGQLAEILGPEYITADTFLRTIGMERAAQTSIDIFQQATDTYNQTLFHNLSRFADGVNFYILNVGPNLPLEFKLLDYQPRPWTLVDSLSIGRILDYSLSWTDVDLRFANTIAELGNDSAWELFPLVPPLQIPVVPENGTSYPPTPFIDTKIQKTSTDYPDELLDAFNNVLRWTDQIKDPLGILPVRDSDTIGSNNWAVNGTKSATGKPIVCNDMHLPRDVPALFYQSHLVSEESNLNIYGFQPAGIPVIIAGHNQYLAWGYTNVAADVIDWYYYNINPANASQYWYNGAWQGFDEEITYIQVKGQGSVPVTIRRTVHGPVLSDIGITFNNHVVAQHWTGQDPSFELVALDKMMKATNYAEFREGQQWWWTISQNQVYGDVHGTIAIQPTGHWPIREAHPGTHGRLPFNGSAGEGEWIGYIPFDELPRSVNPSRGYVASANQLSVMYGTDPGNYPYFIHSYTAPGYRARRINWLLANDDSVTVEDMKRYQLDVMDTMAEAFVPLITAAYDNANATIQSDPDLTAAVNYLRSWNFTMLKEWVEPTIWRAWFDFYEEGVFGDDFPTDRTGLLWPSPVVLENLTRFNPTSQWFDDKSTTGTIETRDDIIISALQGAISRLQTEVGSNMAQWTWDKFHYIIYTHRVGDALGHGPFAADGDAVTLNPSHVDIWLGYASQGHRGASKSGPSERLIVDFNNPLHALSVIPGGQSGNPISSHYSDQLYQLFLVGDYHIDYLYPDMGDLTDRKSILVLLG